MVNHENRSVNKGQSRIKKEKKKLVEEISKSHRRSRTPRFPPHITRYHCGGTWQAPNPEFQATWTYKKRPRHVNLHGLHCTALNQWKISELLLLLSCLQKFPCKKTLSILSSCVELIQGKAFLFFLKKKKFDQFLSQNPRLYFRYPEIFFGNVLNCLNLVRQLVRLQANSDWILLIYLKQYESESVFVLIFNFQVSWGGDSWNHPWR